MGATYYVQALFSLSLLVGVLYLLSRFSKNWVQKKFSGDIQILDRRPIDNGVALVLIELKGRQYLLSVGGKTTQLIERFEDKQ